MSKNRLSHLLFQGCPYTARPAFPKGASDVINHSFHHSQLKRPLIMLAMIREMNFSTIE